MTGCFVRLHNYEKPTYDLPWAGYAKGNRPMVEVLTVRSDYYQTIELATDDFRRLDPELENDNSSFQPRVELHCHSNLSERKGINNVVISSK